MDRSRDQAFCAAPERVGALGGRIADRIRPPADARGRAALRGRRMVFSGDAGASHEGLGEHAAARWHCLPRVAAVRRDPCHAVRHFVVHATPVRLRRPAARAADGALTACSAAVHTFASPTCSSAAALVEADTQAAKPASFAFDAATTAAARLRRWPRHLRQNRRLTPWLAQRHHPRPARAAATTRSDRAAACTTSATSQTIPTHRLRAVLPIAGAAATTAASCITAHGRRLRYVNPDRRHCPVHERCHKWGPAICSGLRLRRVVLSVPLGAPPPLASHRRGRGGRLAASSTQKSS